MSYEKLSSQIQKLANLPPEKQVEHFAAVHQDLNHVAPNIAPHVSSIASNALNFLYNKLPKPAIEFAGGDEWQPSKSQKTQWLDHHDIVNDPVKALDHVKNGTLSNNHMEALQAVHPALLENMQNKVMEHMSAKSMKGLAYHTKISLSKFMGKPLAGSLMPAVVASDQQQFALAQNAPQQGTPKKGQKSSVGGLSKLNEASRTQTRTESMESPSAKD